MGTYIGSENTYGKSKHIQGVKTYTGSGNTYKKGHIEKKHIKKKHKEEHN